MSDRQGRNKQTALDFYDLMFNQCRTADAIEEDAGTPYIQHNSEVADGKQAFIDYFVRIAKDYPGKRVEFKRAFADGNHVILHCHQVWPWNLEALSLRRPLRACWCHPAHDERKPLVMHAAPNTFAASSAGTSTSGSARLFLAPGSAPHRRRLRTRLSLLRSS